MILLSVLREIIESFELDSGQVLTAEQVFSAFGVDAPGNTNDNNSGGNNGGQDSTTPNLIGTDGNDTLLGTAAAETLQGKLGDDTYIYSGGKDTLIDTGGIDKVSFGAGISFVKSGNDFIIRVKGDANNDLLIQDFFSDGNKVIESFELDSGQVITAGQVFSAFGVNAPEARSLSSKAAAKQSALISDELNRPPELGNSLIETSSQSLNAGYEQLIHAMSTFGSGSSAMDLIDDRSLYAPELLAGITPG
ncbi:MAG: hypothetical protein CR977_03790 [Gammaproteobacteria bacterium]|nr:MAG: hypothetical protein CR977_03790 [Gammaproteobacteria bacterium]